MAGKASPPQVDPVRKRTRRRATVVVDELKEQYTGHWDIDLMPRAEAERRYREGREAAWAYKRRQFGWILGLLLLLCLYPTIMHHLGAFMRRLFGGGD